MKAKATVASRERIAALDAEEEPREVRRRALLRFLAWGLGTLLLTVFLFWYFAKPGQRLWINIGGAAVPGAMTLVHLLELVTGVRMSEWERRWAALSSLKKLGMSIVILGAAFFVFMVIALTIVLTGVV